MSSYAHEHESIIKQLQAKYCNLQVDFFVSLNRFIWVLPTHNLIFVMLGFICTHFDV